MCELCDCLQQAVLALGFHQPINHHLPRAQRARRRQAGPQRRWRSAEPPRPGRGQTPPWPRPGETPGDPPLRIPHPEAEAESVRNGSEWRTGRKGAKGHSTDAVRRKAEAARHKDPHMLPAVANPVKGLIQRQAYCVAAAQALPTVLQPSPHKATPSRLGPHTHTALIAHAREAGWHRRQRWR